MLFRSRNERIRNIYKLPEFNIDECFTQDKLNYPNSFKPNKGDDKVTAAMLFKVYNDCQKRVDTNIKEIQKAYAQTEQNFRYIIEQEKNSNNF